MRIGTAGWSFGKDIGHEFAAEGTVLQRYASRFSAVEINSSFHRPHRASTWAKWADSVHDTFRFSVKLPKEISHLRKLRDCDGLLDQFLGEAGNLGEKLGVLLLQLPPKLEFDAAFEQFLGRLADNGPARVVCEPRHPSWFDEPADALLKSREIARVAADPAITPSAALPGGWRGLSYHRLHGSPVIYRSSYSDRIDRIAATLVDTDEPSDNIWCIFDNTASSAATSDALALKAAIEG